MNSELTPTSTPSHNRRPPRICIFSQRHLHSLVSRCPAYEFEDVISRIDDVDLLTPEPRRFFPITQRIANRLARTISIASSLNPGVRRSKLNKDYDLFIALCQFTTDLPSLNALKQWKGHCRKSVCYLEELWAGQLDNWKAHLKILSNFDYIVLNCSASTGPLEKMIGRPCFYMPPGVDAIAFCPYPNPPVRSIDVYNLGRRSPITHKSLLRMAGNKHIFYIYDTIKRLHTFCPTQHRDLITNIAKRSRYFITNAAKSDRQFETNGQSEIGFRFLEGAAAGTVMIGVPPNNHAFREYFDWPDAVIPIPFHAPNMPEILAGLDAQPQRLRQARTNNITNALLRHDWAHRWSNILNITGLSPAPALAVRKTHLEQLAEMAGDYHLSPPEPATLRS